jgi:diacylglycerol kinase (ATP)
MPRATLIHNTSAGDGRPSGSELREIIERHGYRTTYATADDDIDALLQDPGDLVVVAGGDGTVGQVAARLLSRDIPLGILPVGTANNLAISLGVSEAVDQAAAAWEDSDRRLVDVGAARGPWGVTPFIESFGLGVFAHAMPILSALKKHADKPPARDSSLRQDRSALRKLAAEFAPRALRLRLDGRAVDGRYLMVEAMNAPMLGPRLRLAPAADPGDGFLDVVLVGERDRGTLERWIEGDLDGVPELLIRRARAIDLLWDGDPIHIDGETWAEEAVFRSVEKVGRARGAPVRVALETRQVTILAPRRTG